MATKSYNIVDFKQGMFMCWDLFSQAAFEIFVTLKDDTTTYLDRQPFNGTEIGTPVQGSNVIGGNNLSLTVEIPSSGRISGDPDPFAIRRRTDDATVGETWILAIEDSADQDYNDLYVSLVAWNTKG